MAVLAPVLVRYRNAIDRKWPKRPKKNDGWIGDQAHQARKSDHNPNRRDRVDALDIDSTAVVHVPTIIASAILHPSTNYIIHKRRIMDASDKFAPHAYTGSADHNTWVHVSVEQNDKAEKAVNPWRFVETKTAWAATVKEGAEGDLARYVQAFLNGHGYTLTVDGHFGPKTTAAVKNFQSKHELQVDGWVGPKTRKALQTV